jgi:glycerophosphoryl diester phosphodiesterase
MNLIPGCLLVPLAVAAGPSVELVAHRGESADAPENTLAAFKLAYERSVPIIELDVHLSKDGRLIVCHDPDTKRTTGVDLKIKDSTYEELRNLDAGSWKGVKWAGEKLPTLDEVLATLPAKTRCFIEIKVGPEAVPAVAKAVRASGKGAAQLAIISFNADTLVAVKKRMPELPTYYVSGFKRDEQTGVWSPGLNELIATANHVGADGLDLSYKGPVDRDWVRKIKAAGLKFYVWTVDEVDVARKYVEWGADGITTNKAGWLRGELKR